MTRMKPYIARMLTLLPKEFDSALLGYAESGTGRAIVLPVYDIDTLSELLKESEYTMERLAEWEASYDSPLLLKRMTHEQAVEQNELFKFKMLKNYSNALLGVVGTWEGEECFLYDMNVASGQNEFVCNRILSNELPGHDMCFLLGTSELDLAYIKEKADRYSYYISEDLDTTCIPDAYVS